MTKHRYVLMLMMLLVGIALVSSLACRRGSGFAVGFGIEGPAPTVPEAQQFIALAEKRLELLGKKAARTGWVQNNFITVDT